MSELENEKRSGKVLFEVSIENPGCTLVSHAIQFNPGVKGVKFNNGDTVSYNDLSKGKDAAHNLVDELFSMVNEGVGPMKKKVEEKCEKQAEKNC